MLVALRSASRSQAQCPRRRRRARRRRSLPRQSAARDSGRDAAWRADFAFDDEAQRKRWSNLPTGPFTRAGLRMGDLDGAAARGRSRPVDGSVERRRLRESHGDCRRRRAVATVDGPRDVRQRRVLRFVRRRAVDDRALVDPVRRASSGAQHHADRRAGHARTEPYRGSACYLRARRQDRAAARARGREGVCAASRRSTSGNARRPFSASRSATSCSAPGATGKRSSRKESGAPT